MKRIFSFVLSALLAVVFTTAHAQQNIFIWKGGNIAVKSAANIDSITTSAGSWLFDIGTCTEALIASNEYKGSFTVSFADNVQSLSHSIEVGVCFSSEKATPTYADEHKHLGSSVSSYDFTLYELDPGTTYYFRAYVKLGNDVFYGNMESITTLGEKSSSSTYILINGHKFVDLGLPSGLLWAHTNVGAASSVDDGDYFAWGETEHKSYYDMSTYKWGDYNEWGSINMTKYNLTDKKTTLDSEDDVATVNWGTPCRMPDTSEFEELVNKCDWAWQSSYNGTSGYLVTGPNGKTIFFPASGDCYMDSLFNHGTRGNYRSRSLGSNHYTYARLLNFGSDYVKPTNNSYRWYGLTVRPVAEK